MRRKASVKVTDGGVGVRFDVTLDTEQLTRSEVEHLLLYFTDAILGQLAAAPYTALRPSLAKTFIGTSPRSS